MVLIEELKVETSVRCMERGCAYNIRILCMRLQRHACTDDSGLHSSLSLEQLCAESAMIMNQKFSYHRDTCAVKIFAAGSPMFHVPDLILACVGLKTPLVNNQSDEAIASCSSRFRYTRKELCGRLSLML